MITNKGKLLKWISRFYCCPLCQVMETDKQEIKQHIALNHTEEQAKQFIQDNE